MGHNHSIGVRMPLAKFSRDPQKNVTVAYTKNKETDTVADPQRGEE